jgi:hypothetical protein
MTRSRIERGACLHFFAEYNEVQVHPALRVLLYIYLSLDKPSISGLWSEKEKTEDVQLGPTFEWNGVPAESYYNSNKIRPALRVLHSLFLLLNIPVTNL